MSWETLTEIFRELAPDHAGDLEARIREALPGETIYIPARPKVGRAAAHEAVRRTGGDVGKAARELGLHRSTMYRKLRERTRPAPGPNLPGTGRIVR